MIIETSCNRFYRVWDITVWGRQDESMAHVWYGVPVRKSKGEWILTAAACKKPQGKSVELVRKAATRVVEA